jgi:hypothetical protein
MHVSFDSIEDFKGATMYVLHYKGLTCDMTFVWAVATAAPT